MLTRPWMPHVHTVAQLHSGTLNRILDLDPRLSLGLLKSCLGRFEYFFGHSKPSLGHLKPSLGSSLV